MCFQSIRRREEEGFRGSYLGVPVFEDLPERLMLPGGHSSSKAWKAFIHPHSQEALVNP